MSEESLSTEPSPNAEFATRRACRHALMLIAAGLVLAIYAPTLLAMAAIWSVDPDYSHGFLVPIAAVAFAVMCYRRGEGSGPADTVGRDETISGALAIACGLLLHAGAWLFGNLLIDGVSLIIVLRGLLELLGGARTKRRYAFPVLFLIFMAPWPPAWIQPLSLALQQAAAVVATWTFNLLGIAAFRQGDRIFLTNDVLGVGAACSGLRSLMAILCLAAAIAFFGKDRRPWYRWGVFLSAPIVAVVANWIRVVATGLIAQFIGPEWARGIFHQGEGLIVSLLAGILLLGIAAWFAHIDQRRPASENERAATTDKLKETLRPLSCNTRAVCAIALLLVGGGLCYAWQRHLDAAIPEAGRATASIGLSALPLAFDGWQGQDRPIDNPDWLYADEHLHRVYRREGTDETATVWIAYSATAKDRQHHPQVCMAVAGKAEDPRARSELQADDGAPIQRYRFGTTGDASTVYYWHYTLPTPDADSLDRFQKLYRLLNHKPRSVTVEIFDRAGAGQGDDALDAFALELERQMRDIVGAEAIRGSSRVPVKVIP